MNPKFRTFMTVCNILFDSKVLIVCPIRFLNIVTVFNIVQLLRACYDFLGKTK